MKHNGATRTLLRLIDLAFLSCHLYTAKSRWLQQLSGRYSAPDRPRLPRCHRTFPWVRWWDRLRRAPRRPPAVHMNEVGDGSPSLVFACAKSGLSLSFHFPWWVDASRIYVGKRETNNGRGRVRYLTPRPALFSLLWLRYSTLNYKQVQSKAMWCMRGTCQAGRCQWRCPSKPSLSSNKLPPKHRQGFPPICPYISWDTTVASLETIRLEAKFPSFKNFVCRQGGYVDNGAYKKKKKGQS
jgi:hypothetical protein